jgi:hypothetical protein
MTRVTAECVTVLAKAVLFILQNAQWKGYVKLERVHEQQMAVTPFTWNSPEQRGKTWGPFGRHKKGCFR